MIKMIRPFIVHLVLMFSAGFLPAVHFVYAQQAKGSKWPRGVTYEIFIQSFCDSDGDGKGDIKGMTSKLDYIKSLGAEGIWLMPIHPSPSYHKYDVTDYYGIHPDYGTLDDFRTFVQEAHKRGIHVVIDLVLNHSSSEHHWFKEAKKDEKSPYRHYYVWTHKDDLQIGKRVTKTGGDSDNRNWWHKADSSDYRYFGFFYGGMPDLNFDNASLREEVFRIGRFWLSEIGVDGFRLDAARHIFPDNRAEDNHWWWEYFRSEMQKVKKDVYLIGEVWAPAEEVGPYMNGLPALFNFDLGFALTKAVNEEKKGDLVAMHKKIRDFYRTVNPQYVDATFLTNHDQNRIMSAVNGDVNKAKVAAALLFTLPGSPYIYYGEEIGMKGKKPDPHIREPFLWDAKAKDRCRTGWITPRYNTDTSIAPLSQQMKDKNSLFHHYKTFIALRNSSNALAYGELQMVELDKKEVAAFERIAEDESLLVVQNLSKEAMSINVPQHLKAYTKLFFATRKAVLENNLMQLPAYSTLILKR